MRKLLVLPEGIAFSGAAFASPENYGSCPSYMPAVAEFYPDLIPI